MEVRSAADQGLGMALYSEKKTKRNGFLFFAMMSNSMHVCCLQ